MHGRDVRCLQILTDRVEPQCFEVGHRAQTPHLLERTQQCPLAHIEFSAKIQQGQWLGKMSEHVVLGATNEPLRVGAPALRPVSTVHLTDESYQAPDALLSYQPAGIGERQ